MGALRSNRQGHDGAVTRSEHPTPTDKFSAGKAEIRARMRAQRQARTVEDRSRFAHRLVNSRHPALDDAASVALYVGVGDEPHTLPLVEALYERGVQVLLPVVLPDFSLDWAVYGGPDSLVPAGYGLLEPSGPRLGPAAIGTVDVVLAPALAVDQEGRRVGQGAGCYDRALAFVPAKTPVLAIVFDDERLNEALPEDPHDRRVDGLFS